MSDTIDRGAAIDAIKDLCEECDADYCGECRIDYPGAKDAKSVLEALPPAQPEPLSDAYMNAVWTWLIDYQIRAAKLKGRYTPYEVLSWVANDWRKEHERYNQQTRCD